MIMMLPSSSWSRDNANEVSYQPTKSKEEQTGGFLVNKISWLNKHTYIVSTEDLSKKNHLIISLTVFYIANGRFQYT